MNDPQVVALIYHIEHDNSVNYEKTRSLVRKEPEFRVKVKDKKVCFKLKKHYATESKARKSVKEYIRALGVRCWFKATALTIFKLKFDRAKIVDRNPTPGSNRRYGGLLSWEVTSTPTYCYRRTSLTYPSPPSGLSIDA